MGRSGVMTAFAAPAFQAGVVAAQTRALPEMVTMSNVDAEITKAARRMRGSIRWFSWDAKGEMRSAGFIADRRRPAALIQLA
jgi:hypothetical protein